MIAEDSSMFSKIKHGVYKVLYRAIQQQMNIPEYSLYQAATL